MVDLKPTVQDYTGKIAAAATNPNTLFNSIGQLFAGFIVTIATLIVMDMVASGNYIGLALVVVAAFALVFAVLVVANVLKQRFGIDVYAELRELLGGDVPTTTTPETPVTPPVANLRVAQLRYGGQTFTMVNNPLTDAYGVYFGNVTVGNGTIFAAYIPDVQAWATAGGKTLMIGEIKDGISVFDEHSLNNTGYYRKSDNTFCGVGDIIEEDRKEDYDEMLTVKTHAIDVFYYMTTQSPISWGKGVYGPGSVSGAIYDEVIQPYFKQAADIKGVPYNDYIAWVYDMAKREGKI